jgi:hypothetical protein
MKPSPRQRLLQALSLAIAALPFAFALIRFVKSGSDVRYFWVALASFLGAITVVLGGGRQRPTLQAALTRSAAAFVIATLFAALAEMQGIVFIGSGKISFGKLSQALDYGALTLQIQGDFDDWSRFRLVRLVDPVQEVLITIQLRLAGLDFRRQVAQHQAVLGQHGTGLGQFLAHRTALIHLVNSLHKGRAERPGLFSFAATTKSANRRSTGGRLQAR